MFDCWLRIPFWVSQCGCVLDFSCLWIFLLAFRGECITVGGFPFAGAAMEFKTWLLSKCAQGNALVRIRFKGSAVLICSVELTGMSTFFARKLWLRSQPDACC